VPPQFTPQDLLAYLLEGNTPTSAELEQFVRENPIEDLNLEYKDGKIATHQERQKGSQTIREYVSGFANSDGGVLIIGVSDDHSRTFSPCAPDIRGQSLEHWASDCLLGMAAYFSPPPRFREIKHPNGPLLTIAVARAPSLVLCIVAGKPQYFLRHGHTTFPAPEYLITDLVLGRRQHAYLEVRQIHPREEREDYTTQDGLHDVVRTWRVNFAFNVENLGLIAAEDVQLGAVLWSLSPNPGDESNSYLRSYIEVDDLKPGTKDRSQFRVVQRSTITKATNFHLAPFQSHSLRDIGPFRFPTQVKAQGSGAVYVLPKGSPPIWFQLEFEFSGGKLTARLARKGQDRPKVAWIESF